MRREASTHACDATCRTLTSQLFDFVALSQPLDRPKLLQGFATGVLLEYCLSAATCMHMPPQHVQGLQHTAFRTHLA